MRVLLLNGSPKGGRSNSLRLAEAFLEGMAQAGGELDIERLDISQMDIKPCLGCFSCWKETPGRCCISDDMPLLLEKLLWADLTVWSFPLYYFGLPGKLKTALDRQLPLSLPFMLPGAQGGGHPARYDMGGKRTVLVSTCGFYTAEHNYGSVTAQFDRLCGEGNYTALFCGEGELFGVPELSGRTGEYLASVRRAGQEYACGGISAETQARLREPLFPRDVYERMADASWGISRDGEKEDEALSFTRQMAALYEPSAYNGRDMILDMDYTDIGKRYRIILGKTGSRVTVEFDEKPTTVIHTPLRVWRSIAAGEIEGPDALMRRMYTVEGDFELLLKWDDYFGPRKGAASAPVTAGKTDMRYVLSPWIVFWIAAGIHGYWGSLLSIFACGLLPLLFFRCRKTVYDLVSGALVCLFSLLLLVGLPAVIVMPLSYFAFGMMWSISVFLKIPLSAEYSMNDYGGEPALKNPMFIRTNRILTAAWGVLYLLTPIWTWFIMRSAASSYVGLINSVLPALLGLFTLWFQKWYPRRMARP